MAMLAALPAGAAPVLVLNSGEASLSVLDRDQRVELRRVPVLREPHHVVLSPDGRVLLVADSAANELLFLDPQTMEIRRREQVSNPYHFAFTPDGTRLVVTSLRRNQIDIYDWNATEQSLTLRHRLAVGDMPSHLAFTPDSRIGFGTLQGVDRVIAFEVETGQVLWDKEVGRQPAGVTYLNGKLLVGNMGEEHVAVMNPADGTVERRIVVGRGAHTVFVSPDGKHVYATRRVDSGITVLDPQTFNPIASWRIRGGPDCIDFAPDGRLWATLRWVKQVAVIDPETGAYETIDVGRSPHGIFVSKAVAEPAESEPAQAGEAVVPEPGVPADHAPE